MRFLYCILPLLGAVTLAQELALDKCECPQVKCPGDDPRALCTCLNNRERLCKQICPDYQPDFKYCPEPSPSPTVKPPTTPKPAPTPKPTPKPVTCECIKVSCLQVWPGSCHCANNAAQRCYDDCGGAPPVLQECPAEEVVARAPEPEAAEIGAVCECDNVLCMQYWPESCYCGNAAKEACFKKCGGVKPELQKCPPQTSSTLATSKSPNPSPTKTKRTPVPSALPTHAPCGGGRGNYRSCSPGYVCITDPYTPGCGPPCDGLGICVKDKLCGGIAGFSCEEEGQVCVDDPRDDCDPNMGGADCGGLCVWPHK